MNVMYLDPDPTINARLLCDRHLLAQINEALVMLRGQWPNHPATKWAWASSGNWLWLCKFGCSCALEYQARFGRWHKSHDPLFGLWCEAVSSGRIEVEAVGTIPAGDFSPPTFHGTAPSYREYLDAKHEAWAAKCRPARWTRRETPDCAREDSDAQRERGETQTDRLADYGASEGRAGRAPA